MDWQRRLLEIGLAGGLASGALAGCEQPCVNCAPCEYRSVATAADPWTVAAPVTVDGGADGPIPFAGCPAPQTSPPALYGPPPGSLCWQFAPSSPPQTFPMERLYLPAADDDSSLGYTAQDVLAVVNQSAVASLTWYDGTTTKLHFSVQLSDGGQWGGVGIFDPPPGDCYRAMRIGVQATLATDDGRLRATLDGFVATQDEGGRFDINHITVAIGEGRLADSDGPLASAVPALIGVPADECEYRFTILPKGVTCSTECDPGVTDCALLGGTMAVTGNDYASKQCVSANVAVWNWD